MARRKDFTKANTYTGQKLKGQTEMSYKIDGVRLLYRDGVIVTRNNKQPPGLMQTLSAAAVEKIKAYGDVELYNGDFLSVSSALNSNNPTLRLDTEHVYPLVTLDHRLDRSIHTYIQPEVVERALKDAVAQGYEGLILRNGERWYRVKPVATADVFITGYFEQVDKDKNPKGQLGGFDTNYGKVTAFSEEKRKELWENPEQYIGKLIEVQYKERYHTSKFRYCVKFLNFRDDKDTESFDTPAPPEKG